MRITSQSIANGSDHCRDQTSADGGSALCPGTSRGAHKVNESYESKDIPPEASYGG